jgi:hypothetical protein
MKEPGKKSRYERIVVLRRYRRPNLRKKSPNRRDAGQTVPPSDSGLDVIGVCVQARRDFASLIEQAQATRAGAS